MQILLRQYDGKYYVWKEAKFTKEGYVISSTTIGPDAGDVYASTLDAVERTVNQIGILDVKASEEENYVMCGGCGEVIKNNPESIEAHFAEREAQKDCLTCKSLYESSVNVRQVTYTKNEDGSYNAVSKYKVNLSCRNGYFSLNNPSQETIKRNCVYYRCRHYGVKENANIFTKYPHPFETQITVDTLLAKKCNYEGYNYGFFEYDLKLRRTLFACVNELGVVDHFRATWRNYQYRVYYSDKYDKLFFVDCSNYTEKLPWSITVEKANKIKEKIAAFYKEANK